MTKINAVQEQVMAQGNMSEAEEQGASKIKVKDKLTGITYYSTIEAVRSRGFTFNRGFGNQVGLSLTEWSKNEESQVKIFDTAE